MVFFAQRSPGHFFLRDGVYPDVKHVTRHPLTPKYYKHCLLTHFDVEGVESWEEAPGPSMGTASRLHTGKHAFYIVNISSSGSLRVKICKITKGRHSHEMSYKEKSQLVI